MLELMLPPYMVQLHVSPYMLELMLSPKIKVYQRSFLNADLATDVGICLRDRDKLYAQNYLFSILRIYVVKIIHLAHIIIFFF